jgi:GH25 family lysozyme M1 (1,4-beta-N-acetylmuramidase)
MSDRIDDKLAQLQADGLDLGSQTADLSLADSGRAKLYDSPVLGPSAIYLSPSPGAEPHEVHGAIYGKWLTMGAVGAPETGPLGYPVYDELGTGDGARFSDFEYGSIFWLPAVAAAFEVHGLIADRWYGLGRQAGPLGYPASDEQDAADGGGGRFSLFDGGRVSWKPSFAEAYEVHGAIAAFWVAEALPAAPETRDLGYPKSNETVSADGSTRYNDFEHGTIYWTDVIRDGMPTPAPGAWKVVHRDAVYGVDVSGAQATIDWPKVASQGRINGERVTFALLKVSGDNAAGSYNGPYFARNFAGVRSTGLLLGFYHYLPTWSVRADPTGANAVDAANHFIELVEAQFDPTLTPNLGRQRMREAIMLPPALDVESGGRNLSSSAERVNLLRGITSWLEVVQDRWGKIPMIYTNVGTWDKALSSAAPALQGNPLWLSFPPAAALGDTRWPIPSSAVVVSGPAAERVPEPWRSAGGWTIWQYGNLQPNVAGITGDVDLNRLNGFYEQIYELSGVALR